MTKPIISNPTDASQALTEERILETVQKTLVPMVNQFVESHKGKKFTADDIERLYKELDNVLWKDPRIMDKYKVADNYDSNVGEQAKKIAEEINQEHPLKFTDKLIRGFAEFCNKIGLEKIGAACLKHIEKADLTSKLDVIAKQVASKKKIYTEVGNSDSMGKAQTIKTTGIEH